ncbi:hypothetical protein ROZALSC1DRAFT_15142 [Rozella allomycis CSF55]|uniref:C3H1-type domain-containing protein n=1 Tax=Rozella allomycis (strain CSF55) TaxID=988480 RepID=A0A4P9YG63_ROZAC|nr:hypothetical protein ROZALSC1DRAFT_15142 [Rozella allomycis CSF55]
MVAKTPCTFFLQNKCTKGTTCEYSHDEKFKPCPYLLTGSCKFGNKCKHSHDIPICLYYNLGKCTKGDKCPFRHVKETKEDFKGEFSKKEIPVCSFFIKGTCVHSGMRKKKENRVQFAHSLLKELVLKGINVHSHMN